MEKIVMISLTVMAYGVVLFSAGYVCASNKYHDAALEHNAAYYNITNGFFTWRTFTNQ